MIGSPIDRKVLFVTMFVFLAWGDVFGGFVSAIEGIINAIAEAINAIGSFFAGLFSPQNVSTVSHDASQTYSTTLHFVSDAKSYVSQSISHTFNFSDPIRSVNVSLTVHNAASMHLRAMEVDFHVAGRTFSIPISNPNSRPDVTVDQVIPLPSPLTFVGITVDIAGTLCGSSCSNLTFTPSADLIVSVPLQ